MTAKKKREAVITVKRMAIGRLKPHPRNPRIHPQPDTPEWDALRASILHTYFDPVVWNKRNGLLVSGHLRLKILRAEGYTHVDASVVDFDESTHLARMLAANKQQGVDSQSAVLAIIKDVELAKLDVQLTGFTAGEISAFNESAGIFDVDPSDPPELESGDKAPFRQMTFTVHDEQFEEIADALRNAKSQGGGDSGVNENSNGNALAWICQRFNRG